jgi:hypothetical protein
MKRRRASRFGVFIAVYAAVITFAVAAALATLWCFLTEYEHTLPIHTAESYAASLDTDAITALIESDADLAAHNDVFETREAVISALSAYVTEQDLRVTRDVRATTDDKPVYSLKSGGKRFCTVALTAGKTVFFGLNEWKVASVKLDGTFFPSPEIMATISAPKGAAVTVNGITLDDKYIISTGEYSALTVFERGKSDAPQAVTYRVSGLYAEPAVEATLSDTALIARLTDGVYIFAYPKTSARTITVTAPAGASVALDGVAVDKTFLTGYSAPYQNLTVFESDKSYKLVRYEIGGLYLKPQLSASLNGIALTLSADADSYTFAIPKTAMFTALITAPPDTSVYVNGVKVDQKFSTDAQSYPILDGLERFVGELPQAHSYKITGLYAMPQVTADGENEVSQTLQNGEDGTAVTYSYANLPDKTMCDKLSAAAEVFVRAYVYYNAQGYVNIEENYKAVQDTLLPGTETASLIAQSYAAVEWNTNYDYIEYSKLESADFIVYKDGLYSCDVTFSVEQRRYHFIRDYNETFTLVFYDTADGLKIANIVFNQ